MNSTLSEALCTAAKRHGDQIALCHRDGDVLYSALGGIQPTQKSIELIAGTQSIEEYRLIWQCLCDGKPFLPLNPKFPPERISQIQQAIDFANLPPDLADLADLAYLIFTSGTSGEPKGVPIAGQQLSHYSATLQSILQINSNDKVLQLGDLSFDISIMAMLMAWPHGAQLCTLPPEHTLMATRYAEDLAITVWLSVPSVVSLAAKAGLLTPNSLPHIRIAVFGGEALPYETLRLFSLAAPNARLFNFWGPTEGTISLSHYEIERALLQTEQAPSGLDIIPLGFAHPGVELALWNTELNDFSDAPGELCACSAQVTSGYLNRPDLNQTQFFMHRGKRWYHTGDLAKWHDQYGFCYLGRVDRQIKLKGYRIELQECETALRRASGSDQVAVIAHPKSASGAVEGLVGFLVSSMGSVGSEGMLTNKDESNDTARILEKMKALLPNYMLPDRLIVLKDLPLSANGKIDYLALEAYAEMR